MDRWDLGDHHFRQGSERERPRRLEDSSGGPGGVGETWAGGGARSRMARPLRAAAVWPKAAAHL